MVLLNESASLLSSSCFIQIENMMLLTVLINWEAENLTVRFQNRTTVTVSSFGLGKSSIIPISKCARSTFYLQLVIVKFLKAHKVQGLSKLCQLYVTIFCNCGRSWEAVPNLSSAFLTFSQLEGLLGQIPNLEWCYKVPFLITSLENALRGANYCRMLWEEQPRT